MARLKPHAMPRYWERANVLLTKAEALALIRALTLINSCDLDSGIDVGKRALAIKADTEQKLRTALESMRPKPDVCARCQHHRSHHVKGQCGHIVSCYNDTCGCDGFRGQR